MIETDFTIAVQHPALAGHFPGNPIVPGVVILDEVIQHIKQVKPGYKYCAIPTVKFSAPLQAGVPVKLYVEEKKPQLFSFSCRVEGSTICSGQLRFEIAE